MINADVLQQEVQRAQADFRTVVLWRDYHEAGVALLLIPVWLIMGAVIDLPWTWYLEIPACLWIVAFLIWDRKRHPQDLSEQDTPLLESAQASLRQVEHQIFLLRNVLWWYISPGALPILIFFIHVAWLTSETWWGTLLFGGPLCAFALVIYIGIYYANQIAVRKQLEPRRQELLALIASLENGADDNVSDAYPILRSTEHVGLSQCSGRRLLVAGVCFVVILSIGIGGIYAGYKMDNPYPKASPFEAVRWEESEPEVKIDGEWYGLVSLNDLPAADIVEFSQRHYKDKWQKRFEEDLVELLTLMEHPPENSVTLVVQSLATSETLTLEDVPMTSANRRAIRNAAKAGAREANGPPDAAGENRMDTESFDVALESIRAEFGFPAMTAFVMRDGAIIERATVGTRSTKDNTPVSDDAPWHLGSNTKAMTATLAGVLVEEGLLRWDMTIGEVLGKTAPDMHSGHRDTTLTMLLNHTGGITPNIKWFSAPKDRVTCVTQMLSSRPTSDLGSYAYSNGGYVVAGAMLEVVTGNSWEDLMREKLFAPLGMTDSGFGAPSGTNAPWGHRSGLFSTSPMPPTTRGSDNPPVVGPAGTVHATLEDYARFVGAHLKGAQGQDGIVTADTFRTLHSPTDISEDYGLGWNVTERSWAGGRALSHSGSNTLWFATVWLAPEKDMAFFAATNTGASDAFTAVDEAITVLIGRHLD